MMTACWNTHNPSDEDVPNLPPTIQIASADGSVTTSATDQMKLALKTGTDRYAIQLVAADAEGTRMQVSGTISGGDGSLLQFNRASSTFLFSNGRADVAFKPASAGDYDIRFTAVDEAGATAVAALRLQVFHNLPPIAAMHITPVTSGVRTYNLDATDAYDADAAWGGAIDKYEWTIDGMSFTSRMAVTPFIFPQPAIYAVQLVVIDNDGARSAAISQTITVE